MDKIPFRLDESILDDTDRLCHQLAENQDWAPSAIAEKIRAALWEGLTEREKYALQRKRVS